MTEFWLKWKLDRFIHSFILETYIAPLQETTTQRRPQPSHGQKRRTSEKCKIWKGRPSARNAAQRGDHSMLMDPQPKRPFAAKRTGTRDQKLTPCSRTQHPTCDTGQRSRRE